MTTLAEFEAAALDKLAAEAAKAVETKLFAFLNQKYLQRADERQAAMGLQYMEAETHDLAREIVRFFLKREGLA
jgi:hypothetical protein